MTDSGHAEMPAPPWWRPRAAKPARRPLGQDAIVDAALGVLQAEGLDALSMRRVAGALDTGPSSLYAYVSGKDELLELVTDRVLAEVEVPDADPEHWQERLKELARSIQRILIAHHDIARAMLSRVPTSPNGMRIGEGVLAILRAGGVPRQAAAHAVDRLSQYVVADVVEHSVFLDRGIGDAQEARPYFAQVRAYMEALPRERFPYTVDMVDELMTGDGDERFEFGLDLLVRGLASYVEPSR